MINGDIVERPWLVYSISKDAVFCFCCKLFAQGICSTKLLCTGGFSDWNHLNRQLTEHETNPSHMTSFRSWKTLEFNIKSNTTIDSRLQISLDTEISHWKDVLKRLMVLVRFLGTQSLAFRGSSDVLYNSHNGNFLKLVEGIAEFDIQ